MVVLVWPTFCLGRRHLDVSQFATPFGSLCLHSRAPRVFVFLVAFLVSSTNAATLAVFVGTAAGGGLGNF
jgi:hypothetical protein